MTATEVRVDLLERLRQSAADLRDAETAAADRRRLRDRLVVEAVEEGFTVKAVKTAIGKSHGLVTQILARPE